ncbi:ABC transporter ATP-binding protein [Shinella yambaruensis]|uniref:ABC transporter n=1 Tax=Shinella yambaruensis TaxID=415996 RepID=A0ABQ5ZPK0_9HYPH|nr:ABC transporter ATP-binding protein [Shinella yambaruensis]MCJ8028896.1 ABC transporter ATP-binding protein [Shinella yambaruensis]MCU7981952.1 ABC transporter ATP-binding protein [Shinella yambaruensis]GLR54793.1 ABC transporter [Shinella yambaruensis]
MSILTIENLSATLAGKRVVDGVSLTVGKGSFTGLIGPNGAGKSTFLRACLGLVPASGMVRLDGVDLAGLRAAERARHLAYLPQERETAWAMSVEAVVALGRLPHHARFAAPSERDRAAIEAAITRMDLSAFRYRAVTSLSGGERARVLIARALAQETPVLLADEPLAGLDPQHQIALMRLFRELAAEGRIIIASMHDLTLAARWCDRLLLLHRGRAHAEGRPEAVLTARTLEDVYTVEAFIGAAAGGLIVQPVDLSQKKDEDDHG